MQLITRPGICTCPNLLVPAGKSLFMHNFFQLWFREQKNPWRVITFNIWPTKDRAVNQVTKRVVNYTESRDLQQTTRIPRVDRAICNKSGLLLCIGTPPYPKKIKKAKNRLGQVPKCENSISKLTRRGHLELQIYFL